MKNINLNIPIITSEEMDLLFREIGEIKKLIQSLKLENQINLRYSKQEARQILKVSQKTMDNYLNHGVLPFSQYKAKIYIKATDLEDFFNKYYVNKNRRVNYK